MEDLAKNIFLYYSKAYQNFTIGEIFFLACRTIKDYNAHIPKQNGILQEAAHIETASKKGETHESNYYKQRNQP